ncbi:hypothetical protein VTJ49DRAFT_995 [Mycothermus thermophilus]|uniref:Sidoreflexin n=1 Tax=Humicola insolens TaxID=85995 RepID=A0ABR3VEV7_HUMIN
MSASLPGHRALPESQYDLNTYWGRVRHTAGITDPRTLFVGRAGLEQAKNLLVAYKQGQIQSMTPELWKAKKIVDSTLHPDTGEPVFLPFRMSCFVLSNLVVTAGMLTPNLGTRGTIAWQVANQSLNVAINYSNSNKSSPLSWSKIAQSYFLAVTASCSVAVGLNSLVPRLKRLSPSTRLVLGRLVPFAAVASAGALNVFLMRGEEMRTGIDVFPAQPKVPPSEKAAAADGPQQETTSNPESLGKSKKAATLAVAETAASRVFNSSPIMVIPPLVLVRLQRTEWLKRNPRWTTPVNLGLILLTSYAALPLALAAFPQRQRQHRADLHAFAAAPDDLANAFASRIGPFSNRASLRICIRGGTDSGQKLRINHYVTRRPARWLAFVYTCRQVHAEAISIIYRSHQFGLVDTDPEIQLDKAQSFLNAIGPANAGCLTDVQLNFPELRILGDAVEGNAQIVELADASLACLRLCSL